MRVKIMDFEGHVWVADGVPTVLVRRGDEIDLGEEQAAKMVAAGWAVAAADAAPPVVPASLAEEQAVEAVAEAPAEAEAEVVSTRRRRT